MNSVLFAASSLLSAPACLVYGRSLLLVATQFATLQGTPLLFVLILMLDLSIAALIVLDSRRSKLREHLPKELHEPQCMLRLQPKWFLTLLDNAHDGILLITPEAQILYALPLAQETYGPSPETLVGRSVLSFIHDSDQGRMVQAMDVLRHNSGATLTVELRCRRADGSWHWTECTGKNLLAELA